MTEPTETIRAKFDELAAASPEGVTLKELDVALIADGLQFDPHIIRDAFDGETMSIRSVRTGDGDAVQRNGFNVWEKAA